MNEKLERIADLIQEGCTSGYYPCWILTAEWEDDVTDIGLNFIATQIKEGHTSGCEYDDIIGLISWSIEIDEYEEDIDEDDYEFSEDNGYSYYDSEEDYNNY